MSEGKQAHRAEGLPAPSHRALGGGWAPQKCGQWYSPRSRDLQGDQVLKCDPAEVLLHKHATCRTSPPVLGLPGAGSLGAPQDLTYPFPRVQPQDMGEACSPHRGPPFPVREMWRHTGHRAFIKDYFQ